MAHAAKLSDLTDGLIRSLAGDRSQHASFRRMRDQAAKTFRNTTHARTNQFDVRSKLSGLVEKFAVLNRDDLSDALQARLDELPGDSKWMPEILSLLLQLSDRPLEKTRIEDIEVLSKVSEDEQPGLTWEDLVAGRALDETGIWDDIERGYHSSGDEYVDEDTGSDDTSSTRPTSVEDDTIALAKLHIVQPDERALDDLRQAERQLQSSISELRLIRETLFMLQGLPTKLYAMQESDGHVTIRTDLDLETALRATIRDLLLHLTEIGTALNSLRHWVRQAEKTPYMQSCQATISTLITVFNGQMSAIEQRYAAPTQNTVVSLISVQSEMDIAAKPLAHLARIISATKDSKSSPFVLFDALYSEISIVEMSGEDAVLRALVPVFLLGLQTYLRPLALWIQTGSVDSKDPASMVVDANPNCDLGRLWADRFELRKLPDGSLCCPKVMRGFAEKIFATGKSRAFLQALGNVVDNGDGREIDAVSAIDAIRGQLGALRLLPSSQLLDDALEHWLAETSNGGGSVLQQKLLHEHGLIRCVDRLDEIFCSKNSDMFQAFADTLFWRMDHQQSNWRHSFLLTELAASTFLGDHSSGENLSIYAHEDNQALSSKSSIRQLGSINLSTTFPWPVQNITRVQTSEAHSKAFAFLLQTYRAKYLLRTQALELKAFASSTDSTNASMHSALPIRQRLIAFVDIMHDHITNSAHILHKSMRSDLQAAADIDAMATVWSTHIKDLNTSLLLSHRFNPIREAIVGCLELCEQFAKLWHKATGLQSSAGEKADTQVNRTDFADMRQELVKSTSFIVAGVRSIGRASGNKMLEELAERLEWMAPT